MLTNIDGAAGLTQLLIPRTTLSIGKRHSRLLALPIGPSHALWSSSLQVCRADWANRQSDSAVPCCLSKSTRSLDRITADENIYFLGTPGLEEAIGVVNARNGAVRETKIFPKRFANGPGSGARRIFGSAVIGGMFSKISIFENLRMIRSPVKHVG